MSERCQEAFRLSEVARTCELAVRRYNAKLAMRAHLEARVSCPDPGWHDHARADKELSRLIRQLLPYGRTWA